MTTYTSKEIFDHLRKPSITQLQVDTFYKLLGQGVDIDDIAVLVGLEFKEKEVDVTIITESKYKLSQTSLNKLVGVNDKLSKVIKRAIELTEVDFGITEGLRTKARQAELVKSGASQTQDSNHLTGNAVDVVAWVGGNITWDFQHYIKIADAVRQASIELGIKVKWGGSWKYLDAHTNAQIALDLYLSERKKLGKKPFLDGVHFEL